MLSELVFVFVKYPNQKTHECESEGFQVLYNYYSNFFLWSGPFQKWCFKKESQIVFSKWDLTWHFWGNKNLKRPNTQKYALVLVVACRKLKSNSAL